MLNNLIYRFKNRNSNKNLKKKINELEKTLSELRGATTGQNSLGFITFSVYGTDSSIPTKDDSLQAQINDIRNYLGITYEQTKLAPKPKEDKTK